MPLLSSAACAVFQLSMCGAVAVEGSHPPPTHPPWLKLSRDIRASRETTRRRSDRGSGLRRLTSATDRALAEAHRGVEANTDSSGTIGRAYQAGLPHLGSRRSWGTRQRSSKRSNATFSAPFPASVASWGGSLYRHVHRHDPSSQTVTLASLVRLCRYCAPYLLAHFAPTLRSWPRVPCAAEPSRHPREKHEDVAHRWPPQRTKDEMLRGNILVNLVARAFTRP